MKPQVHINERNLLSVNKSQGIFAIGPISKRNSQLSFKILYKTFKLITETSLNEMLSSSSDKDSSGEILKVK